MNKPLPAVRRGRAFVAHFCFGPSVYASRYIEGNFSRAGASVAQLILIGKVQFTR